jgi:hypothetical protein
VRPTVRRPAVLVIGALLVAWALTACGVGQGEPCTQADLDQPRPIRMPSPVAVTQTRRLNAARLDPLPAGFKPAVSAEHAWQQLSRARPATGGGQDELLLGLYTATGYSRVPAWALFTAHLAQPLAPIAVAQGVKPRTNANVCVFVDVLTVVNAADGQTFAGSTVTSG